MNRDALKLFHNFEQEDSLYPFWMLVEPLVAGLYVS